MEKKKEIKKLNLSKKNIQKLQKLDLEMLENTALELKNRLSSIVFAEKKNYYFQIGFNRCATQSLYQAFVDCGLKAIHHNFKTSKLCFREYLATILLDNLQMSVFNKPILDAKLSSYDAFLDMEYIYGDHEFNFNRYFRNIEKQYPSSKFIMNTRECISWLLSRMKLGAKASPYSVYYKNIHTEKLKSWIDYYFEHSLQVRKYFLHTPTVKKRTKLYVYPIQEKSLKEICQELELPNVEKIKEEKVDFVKNIQLTEDEKKYITPEILKYVEDKIKKYGDPSKLIWWR